MAARPFQGAVSELRQTYVWQSQGSSKATALPGADCNNPPLQLWFVIDLAPAILKRAVMQTYVSGFLFSPCGQHVALIQKLNPKWQRGLLNGIGGKIEPGETPHDAMAREFHEEAGLVTRPENWTCFARLHRPDEYLVDFMFCRDARFDQIRSIEQEEVGIYECSDLPAHLMPNLRWLIPMSLDAELDFAEPIPLRERSGERFAAMPAR